MIEKILSELEKLKVYKEIVTSDKHPFCASEIELLSRKKVLEIVQEVAKEYGNASDNDLTVVSALPSLYPLQPFEEEAIHKIVASAKDGGWIPYSERLPEFPKSDEDEKSYLVTVKRNDGFTFWDRLIFHDYGWRIPGNCEVTAWQEVTPYKKGE